MWNQHCQYCSFMDLLWLTAPPIHASLLITDLLSEREFFFVKKNQTKTNKQEESLGIEVVP